MTISGIYSQLGDYIPPTAFFGRGQTTKKLGKVTTVPEAACLGHIAGHFPFSPAGWSISFAQKGWPRILHHQIFRPESDSDPQFMAGQPTPP